MPARQVLGIDIEANGSDATREIGKAGSALDKFDSKIKQFDNLPAVKEFDQFSKSIEKAGKTSKQEAGRIASVGEAAGGAASNSAQAAGAFGDLGGAMSQMGGPLGAVGSGMESLAPTIMGVTGASDLLELVTAKLNLSQAKNAVVTGYQKVQSVALSAATKAQAAAMAVLNAVMDANPIVLVVLAIAGLVAAFVIAYKKSETFRNIVDSLLSSVGKVAGAIQNGFSVALKFLQKWGPLALAVILPFIGIPLLIAQHFNTIGPAVSKPFVTAYDTVKTWIGKTLTFVESVPGKIVKAFEGIGSAIVGAIKSALNSVLHLPLSIPRIRIGAFGKYVTIGGQTLIPAFAAAYDGDPLSRDERHAALSGQKIFMTAAAGGTASPTLDGTGRQSSASAGAVININFNGIVGDKIEAANEIIGVLRSQGIRLGQSVIGDL